MTPAHRPGFPPNKLAESSGSEYEGSTSVHARHLDQLLQLHTALRGLLDEIGPRLTTACLGLTDAAVVKHMAEEVPVSNDPVILLRLFTLHVATRQIIDLYGPRVCAPFRRSAQPALDDEAPVVALAAATKTSDFVRIVAAAKAFVE